MSVEVSAVEPQLRSHYGAARAAPSLSKPHRLHVDCLRGYAILMVIACHTVVKFPEVPWRFKQLVATGWHGVQLFFLASTLTLLMSYDWERTRFGRASWKHFFLRRFLRIAPAYYFAAVVYCVWSRASTSVLGALIFAGFSSAHVPSDLGKSIVPGGWSISVEFSFYLLFPLIATRCHTVRRAMVLLAASIMAAISWNSAVRAYVGDNTLDQFLYFSFLNQLPIFALANLVYRAAYKAVTTKGPVPAWVDRVVRNRWTIPLVLAMLVVAAYLPLPQSFTLRSPWVPAFFWTALWMSVFCVAVAHDRPPILINRVVAQMGVVSFSAYIWHWLVLSTLWGTGLGETLLAQTRFIAMGAYGLAFTIVVGATYCLAYLSYRLIEQPGISLARRLTARAALAESVG